MSPVQKNKYTDILLALLLYATVIIYQGYQYGQSDQSQILPVLYALDHPDAFISDHYVESYLKSGINERTIFHALFRYIGYDHPWMVFLWHAFTSILLFLAWIKIAGLYIKNKSMLWLSIALILTIGFHTSTGSNEIYYNQFIPSLPAKALASWSLYFWLKDKFTWWVTLLAFATYLQPLVGMQLFILTGIALSFHYYHEKILNALPWKQMIAYLLVTIPWIFLLAINNGGQKDPSAFMDIMEFRLSHHFFGSAFDILHLFLGLIFFIIAIIYYKDRLRWIFLVVASGCIVYEVGVEILRLPFVMYTQWWKTTIWLEAFAFLAVVGFLEIHTSSFSKYYKSAFLLPILFLLAVTSYRFSGFKELPLYMSPLSNTDSDEVHISKLANQLTPANSVFIIPSEMTAFRWYAKRSLYVDYKALFHQEDFLNEWYRRIMLVYDYNLSKKKEGISIEQHSKTILENPTPQMINTWKSAGVTHIVSPNVKLGTHQLVGANDTYAIYKLR